MYLHVGVDEQGGHDEVVTGSRRPDEGGRQQDQQSSGQDALVQPQFVVSDGPALLHGCRGDDSLGDQVQLGYVRLGHGGQSTAEDLAGHGAGVQGDAAGEHGLQPASRSEHTGGHLEGGGVGQRVSPETIMMDIHGKSDNCDGKIDWSYFNTDCNRSCVCVELRQVANT